MHKFLVTVLSGPALHLASAVCLCFLIKNHLCLFVCVWVSVAEAGGGPRGACVSVCVSAFATSERPESPSRE